MGTSVSVTPNLEGIEATGTTSPRKWFGHLSRTLRLSNSLLTLGVGGVIPEGLHDYNHMVHLNNLSLSLPSNSCPTKGLGKQLTEMATKQPNERKAPIYRPKGGLSSLRPTRHVANYGRSQPMSNAHVRSGKSRSSQRWRWYSVNKTTQPHLDHEPRYIAH